MVPTVVVALPNRAELLPRYLDQFETGGIFVPGPSTLRVGQRVCADIEFVAEGVGIQTEGIVRWKRHRPAANAPMGIGIQFVAQHAGVLLEFARGAEALRLDSRARRFHTSFPAELLMWKNQPGVIRNMSRTGVFFQTPELIPVGTHGVLRLHLPGLPVVEVEAEVVRTEEGVRTGLGMRFIDRRPHVAVAVRDACSRLARLAVGG